jgi:hypothetical protein
MDFPQHKTWSKKQSRDYSKVLEAVTVRMLKTQTGQYAGL